MDDRDKRKLMKNIIVLKERLGKQSQDLGHIFDFLIGEEIFQFNKKEDILAPLLSDSEKMDKFLKYLTTSGPKAFDVFTDALKSFSDSRYEDVISALDNTELNTMREVSFCKTPGPQQGAVPKRMQFFPGLDIAGQLIVSEVSFYGTSRTMSVMTNQTELVELASKLDQVLETQSKMQESQNTLREQIREDVKAEVKTMYSKIKSTDHTSESKDGAKYKNDIVKLEAKNKELMKKSDTLQKHYDSLKKQLRDKTETVNSLIKENKHLRGKLTQASEQELKQNENKIKQLQGEIKIITDQKETLEKENTILKRTNSFFTQSHPRASLPKVQNQSIARSGSTNVQYVDRYHLQLAMKKL